MFNVNAQRSALSMYMGEVFAVIVGGHNGLLFNSDGAYYLGAPTWARLAGVGKLCPGPHVFVHLRVSPQDEAIRDQDASLWRHR
jgi:hypothetical protein